MISFFYITFCRSNLQFAFVPFHGESDTTHEHESFCNYLSFMSVNMCAVHIYSILTSDQDSLALHHVFRTYIGSFSCVAPSQTCRKPLPRQGYRVWPDFLCSEKQPTNARRDQTRACSNWTGNVANHCGEQ